MGALSPPTPDARTPAPALGPTGRPGAPRALPSPPVRAGQPAAHTPPEHDADAKRRHAGIVIGGRVPRRGSRSGARRASVATPRGDDRARLPGRDRSDDSTRGREEPPADAPARRARRARRARTGNP